MLDLLAANYTLMTIIIKSLTFTMTTIIIDAFELAKPGETHTPDPREPP